MSVLGVVLAGGRSTRMGCDKAQVILGASSLLRHSVTGLAKQLESVAVNRNHPLQDWDGPYIGDVYDTQMGPLLGVLSALRYGREGGFERVLTVPVDAPFFPDDLVARLCAPSNPIVLAACDDPDPKRRLQPAFGCWHVDLCDALDQFLDAGERKVMQFVHQHNWVQVNWPASQRGAFFNINTPDDLAHAQQQLSGNPI